MLMNIVEIEVSKIRPYEKNAKKHSKEQVKNVAESIKQFGWQQPIVVDKDYVIIIGHCRFEAAKYLKLKKVPCAIADDLTEEQVNQLRLIDNKTNESEWDFDLLAKELDSMDMSAFDFDWQLPKEEEEKEAFEDNFDFDNAIPDEPKAKYGDIYQLGNHRLMCGDSTIAMDVMKLMNDRECDLVVTDPPYNMNYQGAGNTADSDRKEKKILNDNLPESEFKKVLVSAFLNCYDAMKDGASFYSFYKEMGNGIFIQCLRESGITFKQELIWVKNHFVLGGSKYQSMYEPILMGCKEKINIWNGKRKQASVIEDIDFMSQDELKALVKEFHDFIHSDIIRENKQLKNDLHPTMKPIRLLAKLIQNSSNKDNIVLDLFGGSGSTLIACEQLDRVCYMMEKEPKYIDVIIERWETFTGKKAVKLC